MWEIVSTALSGVACLVSVLTTVKAFVGEGRTKTEERAKLVMRLERVERMTDTLKTQQAESALALAQVPLLGAQLKALDRLMESQMKDISANMARTIEQLERINPPQTVQLVQGSRQVVLPNESDGRIAVVR